MKSTLPCFTAILALHRPSLAAVPLSITSPDGNLVASLSMADSGTFGYTFSAHGSPVISHSALGLDFGAVGKAPATGWQISETKTRSVNTIWKPLCGKRSVVPDRYRETIIALTGPGAPFDRIAIIYRAYDDGFAFRYSIPPNAKGNAAKATADLTE
jgi:alpha-glucosidase